ncbi:hypothetical protein [Ruegeria marisflavi]|nr:hypothetical protein [Ruegeria sp. WL0004]
MTDRSRTPAVLQRKRWYGTQRWKRLRKRVLANSPVCAVSGKAPETQADSVQLLSDNCMFWLGGRRVERIARGSPPRWGHNLQCLSCSRRRFPLIFYFAAFKLCGIKTGYFQIMAKKPKSDTVTGALAAARESDRTAATGPRDIVGVEALDHVGLAVYDGLFRARTDWPLSDLLLACEAAYAAQTIRRLKMSIMPGTEVLRTRTGTVRVHPALEAIRSQQRHFADLLRAMGLRLRDGNQKNVPTPRPANHLPGPTADATAGPSFNDWLASVDEASPH